MNVRAKALIVALPLLMALGSLAASTLHSRNRMRFRTFVREASVTPTYWVTTGRQEVQERCRAEVLFKFDGVWKAALPLAAGAIVGSLVVNFLPFARTGPRARLNFASLLLGILAVLGWFSVSVAG